VLGRAQRLHRRRIAIQRGWPVLTFGTHSPAIYAAARMTALARQNLPAQRM